MLSEVTFHQEVKSASKGLIGLSPGDHSPLSLRLAEQVADELGEADGVIVFDPSGFVKKGIKSVGVAPQ